MAIIGVGILIFAGNKFHHRLAINWNKPEYKIPTYRNKDAEMIGRTYEITYQEAVFAALQASTDTAYIERVGGKKRGPFQLHATFSETFAEDLVIEVTTKPPSEHAWKRKFARDEVDAGVIAFGKEVGTAFAGLPRDRKK